ncbi:unnamed protein product [Vicia faba]|uniref:Uncharacterized protein n=1 Tax=Vicia faba TaxID=3906 RepID=A0AAV0Z5Q6_VICFA|nr:unnamed protein product [Vicia faba]
MVEDQKTLDDQVAKLRNRVDESLRLYGMEHWWTTVRQRLRTSEPIAFSFGEKESPRSSLTSILHEIVRKLRPFSSLAPFLVTVLYLPIRLYRQDLAIVPSARMGVITINNYVIEALIVLTTAFIFSRPRYHSTVRFLFHDLASIVVQEALWSWIPLDLVMSWIFIEDH